MKLKTLKDFDWIKKASGSYGDAKFIDEEGIKHELRHEALKWMKEMDSDFVTISNGYPITDSRYKEYHPSKDSIIMWIRHFFNIEVEDKEVKNARK